MKAVKTRWIGLSMMVVMATVLAVGLACEEAADDSETRGTLYLVDQDWNGQLVTTAVAQILLEQEMDHTVATKFAPADSAPLFIGLERGDFHFVCCNWPSYSAALLDEYVDAEDSTVERVGPVGITGETGWYVPSYVINGDADRGIEAVAPDLRTVSDLNNYKSVFATSDTGTKGRLLEFTAAWDTRPEERLEAFGADFQAVFAGSEGAALAQVDAAFQRGEPTLTYLWEPHWAHAKYNLVQIEMPEWTSDCYPDGSSYKLRLPNRRRSQAGLARSQGRVSRGIRVPLQIPNDQRAAERDCPQSHRERPDRTPGRARVG